MRQALRRHLAARERERARTKDGEGVRWQIKAGGNFMLIRALRAHPLGVRGGREKEEEDICAIVLANVSWS